MPLAPLLKSGEADAASDCISWRNLRSGVEDWSKICNLTRFWQAINERRLVLGQTALPEPASGCDCQYMGLSDPLLTTGQFSVANLQTWLQTFGPSFIRSHDDDGNLLPQRYWDGSSSIDYWTVPQLHQVSANWLNTLGADPSKDASGFTRLDSTGAIQIGIADGGGGDYFYQALWNELWAFCRLLRFTLASASWDNHGQANSRQADSGAFADWDDAYADAAGKWGTAAAVAVPTADPQAWCAGLQAFAGADMFATLFRNFSYGEFSGLATDFAHEMEVYLQSAVPLLDTAHSTYDNNDDIDTARPLSDGLYRFVESFASATTSARSTGKIGNIEVPPRKSSAPDGLLGRRNPRGWESQQGGLIVTPVGVVKWGMTYV